MRVPLQVLAAVLVVLSACDGKSASPTQPTPLAPPTVPTDTITEETGWGLRLINEEGDEYPTDLQVLLDGDVVFSGPYPNPHALPGATPEFTSISGYREGLLAPGTHTLSLRILQLDLGSETYRLRVVVNSGKYVNGGWDGSLEEQRALWEETVSLHPGKTWTGQFEIRAWSGGG